MFLIFGGYLVLENNMLNLKTIFWFGSVYQIIIVVSKLLSPPRFWSWLILNSFGRLRFR